MGFSSLSILFNVTSVIERELTKTAKETLGADISLSVRRELLPEEKKKFYDALAENSLSFSSELTSLTMVSPMVSKGEDDPLPTLVNIRWISEGYPYYSKLEDQEGKPVHWSALEQEASLMLSSEDAEKLGLKLGDEVMVGSIKVKVAGLFKEGSVSSFRFLIYSPQLLWQKNMWNLLVFLRAIQAFFQHSMQNYLQS
jgi:predicted lysophospholipase L1 biosynthesis ABC-type transport system permease subunit